MSLTPDQLAAIKARSVAVTKQSLQHSREDIFTLVNELERLTRYNQRMAAALAQLSDKENWADVLAMFDASDSDMVTAKAWAYAAIDPQQLAERALVEDE